jgi:hypothetical protein
MPAIAIFTVASIRNSAQAAALLAAGRVYLDESGVEVLEVDMAALAPLLSGGPAVVSPTAPLGDPGPLPETGGPGTELSALLKRFGIEPTPTCLCRAKAAEMDMWGPDECEKPERIAEVVAVMRDEAAARSLPFLDAAAVLLVRRAIANARRKQKARENGPL